MVFEQPHPFPNKSPHYQNILRKCGTCRRATSLANTSPPELHSTLLVSVSASSWALFMWTPHMFKNTNFEMETSGPRKRILAFSYNLHKIYTDDTAQSILHITSLIQNHSQIKPTQMQIQFLQMQCDQSIWIFIATQSLEIGGYPRKCNVISRNCKTLSRNSNPVSWNWWVSSKCNRICRHIQSFKGTGNEDPHLEQIDQNRQDDRISQRMRMCIICNSRQSKPNQQFVLILEVPSSIHIIVCWSVPATEFYVEVVHFMFAIACIVCQLWNYIYCPCNWISWCNVWTKSLSAGNVATWSRIMNIISL